MSGEYLYGHRVAASLEEEQETRNHLVWPAVAMKKIFSSIQSMFPLFFLVNPQTRINNVLLSPINQLWDTLSIGKAKWVNSPTGQSAVEWFSHWLQGLCLSQSWLHPQCLGLREIVRHAVLKNDKGNLCCNSDHSKHTGIPSDWDFLPWVKTMRTNALSRR